MKEEVMAKYKQGQEQLLSEFYDDAAADGAAGKEGGNISQEEHDAAVQEAYQKGVDSVQIPSPDGLYTAEQR